MLLPNCWPVVLAKPMGFKPKLPASNPANRPFALYIHWPFCRAKCPYCNFNSHVSDHVDATVFGDALCTEMDYMASLMPIRPALSSLFFGGGTPSLMPPTLVERLIRHADHLFGLPLMLKLLPKPTQHRLRPKPCLGSEMPA